MIIADAGPLVAVLNADDEHHTACTDFLGRYRGPIIVPAPIITEVTLATNGQADRPCSHPPLASPPWPAADASALRPAAALLT